MTRTKAFILAGCMSLALTIDAGAQTQQPTQQNNITRTEDIKDWKLVCGTPANNPTAPERCNLVQIISAEETGQRVLRVEVARGPEATLIAFTAPLGIFLPKGMEISVDGSPPSAFAIEICQPQGCSAALKLEGELLSKLKQGNKATLTVYDPRVQPLAIPVSLSGFTKGVSKIK